MRCLLPVYFRHGAYTEHRILQPGVFKEMTISDCGLLMTYAGSWTPQ